MYKILTINPGSTSTKIGVFEDEKLVLEETLRHEAEDLKDFVKITDQYEFRKSLIVAFLKKNDVELTSLDAIVGRGGLMKSVKSGTYEVNPDMIEDLKVGVNGQHASNLGGIIADALAKEIGKKAYIVDPVVVDEVDEIARITGAPGLERQSMFHALNQKAVARKVAKGLDKQYNEVNLIVAHLGGGISVGAHQKGRVIDVNNALMGDGPFSPERAGDIPTGKLVDFCFSGLTKKEVQKKLVGDAGFVAHLGTNSGIEVEKMVASGDAHAKLIFEAMGYNVAKEIGSCSTVLSGQVDRIVLTGGIAYSKTLTDYITSRVKHIAEVVVVPGEEELPALAEGGLRVLRGEEAAKQY